MIQVGKINNLYVCRETESGYYLKDKNSREEVFMPPSLTNETFSLYQDVSVFVYTDSKNDLIATTRIPYALVGEYSLLEAVEVQDFGAFFDWGIDKDLLVPGNQQKEDIYLGDDYIVRVDIDKTSGRIFGSTKLGKYIEQSIFDIKAGDKVKILIAQETEIGYRVIVNKKFIGMIYHSEIFKPVKIGHLVDGYVKKIREDKLVDVALQSQGIKNLDSSKPKILQYLKENNGKCQLHDKSDPEEIRELLGMSKKTFKNAIGMLYKDKKIIIKDDGIELTDKN